jgi:hypothetical protein
MSCCRAWSLCCIRLLSGPGYSLSTLQSLNALTVDSLNTVVIFPTRCCVNRRVAYRYFTRTAAVGIGHSCATKEKDLFVYKVTVDTTWSCDATALLQLVWRNECLVSVALSYSRPFQFLQWMWKKCARERKSLWDFCIRLYHHKVV